MSSRLGVFTALRSCVSEWIYRHSLTVTDCHELGPSRASEPSPKTEGPLALVGPSYSDNPLQTVIVCKFVLIHRKFNLQSSTHTK